ncbi:MAG TPA: hypothetical protein VEC09_03985 [Actinomycetota bacterium]|nr:hypothetical protein [Actinomycetota bacterium]
MPPATSSASDALGAYLNDHLAGAAAGIQLAERIAKGTSDERLAALLERFVKEFREDHDVLERVMEAHGITKDRAKQGIALAGEWFTRLKHVAPVLRSGSDTLVALEDIEVLSLGIEGRILLLRALQQIPSVTALGDVDLATLEERARRQRDELEPFRLRFVAATASPTAP